MGGRFAIKIDHFVSGAASRPTLISYHENGDYYLVLDTQKPAYFWFDTQDFDDPALVARNVEELLSWWWNQAAELVPETLKSR